MIPVSAYSRDSFWVSCMYTRPLPLFLSASISWPQSLSHCLFPTPPLLSLSQTWKTSKDPFRELSRECVMRMRDIASIVLGERGETWSRDKTVVGDTPWRPLRVDSQHCRCNPKPQSQQRDMPSILSSIPRAGGCPTQSGYGHRASPSPSLNQ